MVKCLLAPEERYSCSSMMFLPLSSGGATFFLKNYINYDIDYLISLRVVFFNVNTLAMLKPKWISPWLHLPVVPFMY